MRWTGLRRAAAWAAGLACVVAASLPGTARGEVLVRYEFGEADAAFDPAVTAAGVAASPLQFDPQVTPVGWTLLVGSPPGVAYAVTKFSTVGAAKSAGSYLSNTLAPAPGHAISLGSFRVDVAAYALANATPPYTGQMAVFSSLDGFTDPVYFNFATDAEIGTTDPGPWAVFENTTAFADPLYQDITAPIEFRFYAFGNDSTSHLYFDNVTITGTTAPVPEPTAAAALAAGAFALCRRRQRPCDR